MWRSESDLGANQPRIDAPLSAIAATPTTAAAGSATWDRAPRKPAKLAAPLVAPAVLAPVAAPTPLALAAVLLPAALAVVVALVLVPAAVTVAAVELPVPNTPPILSPPSSAPAPTAPMNNGAITARIPRFTSVNSATKAAHRSHERT